MRLVLKSVPQNIVQIEQFLEQLTDKYQISRELYSDILISLTEAVNNAIIHGNALDRSKEVSVRSFIQTDEIRFEVSDEGDGFNPKEIPDPCKKENIALMGGRGVMLMRALSSEMCFKNGGTRVELIFKRK